MGNRDKVSSLGFRQPETCPQEATRCLAGEGIEGEERALPGENRVLAERPGIGEEGWRITR